MPNKERPMESLSNLLLGVTNNFNNEIKRFISEINELQSRIKHLDNEIDTGLEGNSSLSVISRLLEQKWNHEKKLRRLIKEVNVSMRPFRKLKRLTRKAYKYGYRKN